MTPIKILMVPVALLLLTGCRPADRLRFSTTDFDESPYSLVLAFDLRNDSDPIVVLCIDQGKYPSGLPKLMGLPFGTDLVELDARVAATAGQYSNLTLVGFVVPVDGAGVATLAARPIFEPWPPGLASSADLPKGVFLAQSGLERLFVYKYGAIEEATLRLLGEASGPLSAFPDALAVALPREARGLEIKDGRTEIPPHQYSSAVARYYPSTSKDPNITALQVRYEVPASPAQERLAGAALKFLAAVITPLVGLILLPGKDTTNPRARRRGIAIMIVVQVGVLAALVILLFRAPQQIGMLLVAEVPVILAGALSTAAVLIAKR